MQCPAFPSFLLSFPLTFSHLPFCDPPSPPLTLSLQLLTGTAGGFCGMNGLGRKSPPLSWLWLASSGRMPWRFCSAVRNGSFIYRVAREALLSHSVFLFTNTTSSKQLLRRSWWSDSVHRKQYLQREKPCERKDSVYIAASLNFFRCWVQL